jgi:hypothetical protein
MDPRGRTAAGPVDTHPRPPGGNHPAVRAAVADHDRHRGRVGVVDRYGVPASGDHVIPQGLEVLHVDRGADTGVYHEPNVWMRHV